MWLQGRTFSSLNGYQGGNPREDTLAGNGAFQEKGVNGVSPEFPHRDNHVHGRIIPLSSEDGIWEQNAAVEKAAGAWRCVCVLALRCSFVHHG